MKALNIVLICGAAAGALGITVACSSTTTINGNGDDGGTDSASGDDTSSDNNVADNVTTDTGGGDGGDGASACPVIGTGPGQATTGNPTCDQCIASGYDGGANCCSQATACYTPQSDGAPNACAVFTQCVLACAADGGSLQTCATPCGAMTDGGGVTEALQLSSCVSSNCSAQCPGL